MKTYPEYPNLFVVDHPVVQDKLTKMRDKDCPFSEFRALLQKISKLMAYPVTENMAMGTRHIVTPMGEMDAPTLTEPSPVLVPILRAGLGMVDGLLEQFPDAVVAPIGLYRDKVTHLPHEYLASLPQPIPQDKKFIVLDPILAAGNSAIHAVDVLVGRGVRIDQIILMVLVTAPEGVKAFQSKYPTIPVYAAVVDSHLNEVAYIVPGIGDAGDRIFGTV